LFVHGDYDWVCETNQSQMTTPMRSYCRKLTEVHVKAGHWVPQEQPEQVNAAIARWIVKELPSVWPYQDVPFER
jgi:soluble epoxide hydrolase/lipid-phosphate phosphatase